MTSYNLSSHTILPPHSLGLSDLPGNTTNLDFSLHTERLKNLLTRSNFFPAEKTNQKESTKFPHSSNNSKGTNATHLIDQEKENKARKEDLQRMLKEENQLAKIHKKFKSQTESEATLSDKTSPESLEESCRDDKLNSILVAESTTKREDSATKMFEAFSVIQIPDTGYKSKMNTVIKNCTSVNVLYDQTGKLIFKLEYKEDNEPNKKGSTIFTRDQMISYDPRLVLYYYENHLQFSDSSGFQPESLVRI